MFKFIIVNALGNHRVNLAYVQVLHWKKLHFKLQYVFSKEVFEERKHLSVILGMF